MQKIGIGKQKFSRRHALRIAAVGIMSSTAAAVATQQMTAARSRAAGNNTLPEAVLPDIQLSTALFDEIYKGRHITGALGRANSRLTRANDNSAQTPAPQVLIDGVALHVMTNAAGTYTSVINHYQQFRSLYEVARAAVDSLGDAALVHVHHHR